MEIKNPGTLKSSAGLRGVWFFLVLAGIGTFATAVMSEPARAWSSYVLNHFYFLSLAVGGLFFAAIQWLTSAMWSAPVRRISESFTAYLPIAFVMSIILFFGIHDLYHWSHSEAVQNDPILLGKSGYLNMPFFIIRTLVFVGIWIYFAKKMIGHSISQDTDGSYSHTARNRVLAPIFLILFALTYTLTSFDLLMSLDPHWFSTIFGVYCFAGLFYSTLALTCLLTIILKRKGLLEGIVNDNHLHDLGKFMFAFTVFWAYIGFSQFMLIWYANLPEETGYYIKRLHEGWFYVTVVLVGGKFVIPFFFMLPRHIKRSEKSLIFMAVYMLIAHWIDMLWLVQPEFFENGPQLGWIEAGVFAGFVGLFGLSVSWFLSRFNVVAIGDPRLKEAVHHHHQ